MFSEEWKAKADENFKKNMEMMRSFRVVEKKPIRKKPVDGTRKCGGCGERFIKEVMTRPEWRNYTNHAVPMLCPECYSRIKNFTRRNHYVKK